MAKTGRPAGPPTTSKEILFEDSQLQILDALIAIAQFKPSFTVVVRRAAQDFIDKEMAKPGAREQVEAHLKRTRRVVNLREIRKPRDEK